MASNFERWEKDPFFSAAEEVQESADRMESTYRTLIHALKEPSVWKTEELRRDLRTALGTAKWQLEEFEKAVENSYNKSSCNDTKTRHREFITAMENQISKVEKCLNESTVTAQKPPRPWVHLDERESKELASFLSGEPAEVCFNGDRTQKQDVADRSTPACSNNQSSENKFSKHRRTASAGADLVSWNIEVADDVSVGGVVGKTEQPPRKTPSLSGFLNTMEFASKLQLSKNGYRKLKPVDYKLPETQPVSRGCYERSKSCLESDDDCYQKQLYGWYGAIQRQLQRSQYYVQYNRPTQMIFWALVLIFLFAVITVLVI
ncbi:putative syntaxin 6 [Helianthus annuus]|uniref:Putative syntaxin/t-SNARE family protein n=1 Tax=Helianthus annuus TaxID=4232 RepID=A0A251TYX5_HELAN|nr:uncharacterized protein LOC110879320 isoform X1 [Helianthus annuus]KAF5792258.1 putative syntaxin 6 [Helianthus annuus]KAJ0527219.1 putative syntaxin 6 [Helianthus annuus]KAJ0535885.1 putative syntaxin 6 [Helianthus annuus]KAJ0543622.1 putative syntaxin 6 [Helianthus annuus]KAJ0708677.1 putative syntaxin 6 [Helianthus annuus]